MTDIGTDIAITTSFSIHEIDCVPTNLEEVRCHVVERTYKESHMAWIC